MRYTNTFSSFPYDALTVTVPGETETRKRAPSDGVASISFRASRVNSARPVPPTRNSRSPGETGNGTLIRRPPSSPRGSIAEKPRPAPSSRNCARSRSPGEIPAAPGTNAQPSSTRATVPSSSPTFPESPPVATSPGRAPPGSPGVVSRPMTCERIRVPSATPSAGLPARIPSRAARYADTTPATYSAPRIRPSIFSAAIPRGTRSGRCGRRDRSRVEKIASGSAPWPYRRRHGWTQTPRFPLFPPRYEEKRHFPE